MFFSSSDSLFLLYVFFTVAAFAIAIAILIAIAWRIVCMRIFAHTHTHTHTAHTWNIATAEKPPNVFMQTWWFSSRSRSLKTSFSLSFSSFVFVLLFALCVALNLLLLSCCYCTELTFWTIDTLFIHSTQVIDISKQTFQQKSTVVWNENKNVFWCAIAVHFFFNRGLSRLCLAKINVHLLRPIEVHCG